MLIISCTWYYLMIDGRADSRFIEPIYILLNHFSLQVPLLLRYGKESIKFCLRNPFLCVKAY
ncbi:hypothetical protein Sjap_006748 [Stephania japonica]|uniref:Uncharacterized protein n=1 Tax=Stephania japonica TaxID=461633 RepID=A0AAP0PM91_9MAGN